MKNCDLLALSLYLDSELLLPERRALEKHLRECAPCREELRRLRQSDRALVSWGARREPIPLKTERQILRSIERNRRRRPLATFSRMTPAALGSCVAAVLVLMSANFVRLDQPAPTATSTGSPTAIAAQQRIVKQEVPLVYSRRTSAMLGQPLEMQAGSQLKPHMSPRLD